MSANKNQVNGADEDDIAHDHLMQFMRRIKKFQDFSLLKLYRWPQWVESEAIIAWAVRRSHISLKALGLKIPVKTFAVDEAASMLLVDRHDIELWNNIFIESRPNTLWPGYYAQKHVKLFAYIKYMMMKRGLTPHQLREHIRRHVRKGLSDNPDSEYFC